MRKHMNNYFGYARIFKHARFAVEPGSMDSEGGDIEIDASAGGSGESDSADNKDTSDSDQSLADLRAELARAKAEAQRFKNTNDKLLKEKGELAKEKRAMMTADQIAKEEREERDRQFAEMEKELRSNKYSKKLVGIGMAEADADTFASTLPKLEDEDSFFATIDAFVKAREKTAADTAIQNLLKSRPDINAGHGDADKDDPAMASAKAAVQRKKASAAQSNQDILKNYF